MLKRLITVLGALLACTAPLSAQTAMQVVVNSSRVPVSFVGAWANNASATSVVVTGASTKSGDTVCVGIGLRSTTITVSSVTDSGVSTYTKINRVSNSAGEADEVWCTGAGKATASTTVTVNLSGSTPVVATVGDYHGVGAFGSSTTMTNGQAGPPDPLPISLATTENNDWVLASICQAASGATFTGTNLRIFQSDGGNITVGLIDNKSATPATVTNTITSDQAHSYSAVAVILRP